MKISQQSAVLIIYLISSTLSMLFILGKKEGKNGVCRRRTRGLARRVPTIAVKRAVQKKVTSPFLCVA